MHVAVDWAVLSPNCSIWCQVSHFRWFAWLCSTSETSVVRILKSVVKNYAKSKLFFCEEMNNDFACGWKIILLNLKYFKDSRLHMREIRYSVYICFQREISHCSCYRLHLCLFSQMEMTAVRTVMFCSFCMCCSTSQYLKTVSISILFVPTKTWTIFLLLAFSRFIFCNGGKAQEKK